MADLSEFQGTIANVFIQNKERIFALLESQSQFNALKECVNDLIERADLNNEQDRIKALKIFNSIKNYNHYITTLTTYLTSFKVG